MTGLPDADGSPAVLIGVHRYDALNDLPGSAAAGFRAFTVSAALVSSS